MADINELIEDYAEAFDDVRAEFFPDDATCYLLSGDGETQPFVVKHHLVSGWNIKYSKFRGRFELSYATTEANFARIIRLSNFVAVNGEVYEISNGDTVPPQGNSPFWLIVCSYVGKKKFTPAP